MTRPGEPHPAIVELDVDVSPVREAPRRSLIRAGLAGAGIVGILALAITTGVIPGAAPAAVTAPARATPVSPLASAIAALAPGATTPVLPAIAPTLIHMRGQVKDDLDRPLWNARVTLRDACSDAWLASVATASAGDYAAEFQLGTRSCAVSATISGDGLETHQEIFPPSDGRTRDFVLHPAVKIAAGTQVSLVLAPSDQKCGDWMDTNEWPCRKVHVTTTSRGTLTVTIRWDDPVHELGLQIFRFGASRESPPCCSLPVEAGDDVEVQVLFLNLGYQPFGGPAHGAQSFTLVTSIASR